jgi:ketosteroid isomerase-like protein
VFSDEDRFAIEALHAAWLHAELRGQPTALLEFCTASPVWLPPTEAPLCGRAAILDWLAHQPETAVQRIEIDDLGISGLGPFAWKAATFRTVVSSADGGARTVTGTHGWLLQRDERAAWRIAVVTWTMAGTSTPPSQPSARDLAG